MPTLTIKYIEFKNLYIYNTLIPFMYLTGYRLGPWTWHRLETSIIRTSMTWGRTTWKNFFRKVAKVTEQKYFTTNAFLWEKFLKMQILIFMIEPFYRIDYFYRSDHFNWYDHVYWSDHFYRSDHFHRRDHFYENDKFSQSISKQIF